MNLNGEHGGGIIDALVAIAIGSIMIMGMTSNIATGVIVQKRAYVSRIAERLIDEKLESFAAMEAATIDNSDDQTENNLTAGGLSLTFTRVSDVTVNADNSRTILVTVTSAGSIAISRDKSLTLAVWE